MRFDLFRHAPGSFAFKRVAAPGLGVWKRADAGVGRLRFKQKVENLTAPAAYRAVVSFRWINANGRVFARAQHVTPTCQQPDLRPNLRIGRITGLRTADRSIATYDVTVRNDGLSAARAFDVSLSVGGVPVVPTKTIGLLRAGLRVTLQFTGQRCTGTEPIVATADAGGAVAESNETDNGLTVACPIVGTSSAR
jgi:CARDB protein